MEFHIIPLCIVSRFTVYPIQRSRPKVDPTQVSAIARPAAVRGDAGGPLGGPCGGAAEDSTDPGGLLKSHSGVSNMDGPGSLGRGGHPLSVSLFANLEGYMAYGSGVSPSVDGGRRARKSLIAREVGRPNILRISSG